MHELKLPFVTITLALSGAGGDELDIKVDFGNGLQAEHVPSLLRDVATELEAQAKS